MPKLLVVDDDVVIQKLLQVNFEMEGWTVVIADNGEAGLAAVREHHPDAVLLDVMMPKMDGLAVITALRADPATADVPVILLSAKAQAADLGAGLAAGANDYVTKPFDPLELLDRVNALIA